ncbi:serine/arginine repetitive matrix protein 2-like isoform X2 [Littorina saxatilis]|uniref:serine/arginine repetitive matrix protein 2-like isoform X2 n=1 Tax=Littorina saxatilis TaxID=31220 RepID=UPI0038B5486F
MDISKILDFHRMVMLSAQQHTNEDETSCGPLCQHPACWHSNRRKERGVPHLKMENTDDEEEETDLPTVKVYNMLEDYGASRKDRYPSHYGGRALHDRSSSMRNFSQSLRSDSFGRTTAPFATPVSPDKGSRSHNTNLRVVEVQEVFDKDDLNNRWDETFMTRPYLVWVPNPQRKTYKPQLAITNGEEGDKEVPKAVLTRDLTESMVPLQIKYEREDTIVKRQNRSRSPIFTKGSYPKTPALASSKPDIDAEGVRELLNLPRDVLVQVLDRTKESDFVSREKIHGIIQDVLDSMKEAGRSAHTARDFSPPRTGQLDTSDVLVQQKVSLHDNKRRNLRDAHLMEQRPVFQLDDDKSSTVYTDRDVSDASSTQGHVVKDPRFPGFKKPLPAITAEEATPLETPRGKAIGLKERKKIRSISLGLPELPSGIRQTKAFVYNAKYKPDFTLVPVPTPPQSTRSSESVASEHGTTLRVNVPSITDNRDLDYYGPPAVSRSTDRGTAEDGALHLVSPALSTRVPKAPAGTPATFQSPTKSLMYRDFTAASSLQMGDGRGLPPSREITMSPGHKFWVAGTTTPGAPSPDELGLGTIQETTREMANSSSRSAQQPPSTRTVQFSEPPPQRPTSPLTQPMTEGQTGSPEDWPQVTEPAFDAAAGIMGSRSEAHFITSTSMVAESGSALQRGRSDLGSRGSERSTLARRILDEGGKDESPAPPPPSPEPKEFGDKSGYRGKRESSKSRELNPNTTAAMELLMEQSKSEGSVSPAKKLQSEKTFEKPSAQGQSVEPAIQEEVAQSPHQPPVDVSVISDQFDPVSKVMVSHIAPRPSGSRKKLQETFINVDIPAEDVSSIHTEQGSSTPPDFTSSVTSSPGKNSPSKLSTPKSSAGPSSPVKKISSSRTPSPRKASGRKNSKGNGRGRKGDLAASASEETS